MDRIAFIGSAGIPNRYGGFEAFLEHCAPAMTELGGEVLVTCDAKLYSDSMSPLFRGVNRIFIRISANGVASILHDLIAFFLVFPRTDRIVALGVSGGIWFPLFRICCALTGKRLIVNVDGVEWRRTKFNPMQRLLLRIFDALAQLCSHTVIYDNPGLVSYLWGGSVRKAVHIGYSGDHVLRLPDVVREDRTALTICRIEPENNLDLLIEGVLRSSLSKYSIVGNWSHSEYGKSLKSKYAAEPRLVLMDPIYDPKKLAELRERCALYLHGHSVGGTNPSLVEILYYDCAILCLDVSYNRFTADGAAFYFKDVDALAGCIECALDLELDGEYKREARKHMRTKYTKHLIAQAYLSCTKPVVMDA